MLPALASIDHWLSASAATDPQVTHIVEKIRGEWCQLLGDTEMVAAARDSLSDVLAPLLEPSDQAKDSAAAADSAMQKLPKSREHIDQQEDLGLADSYRQAIKTMEERNSIGKGTKW